MRLTKKFWIGPLMALSVLLAAMAPGQTFPTFKGDNARTGKNATPAITHPGRAFLTWFRPNITDVTSGTIIRNNSAQAPANVNFTGGFIGSPVGLGTSQASFSYDQPSFGDPASDIATGAFAVHPGFDGRTPAYRYATTVNSTDVNNPAAGATQSFTWFMDPTAAPVSQGGVGANFARNYALYVWLPIGPTNNGLGPSLFPQRYWVYQVNYGPGGALTYVEVVDTYAAGTGWVRLGSSGNETNRMFPYDGTNPIRITLLNTVPINPNTNGPSDTAGTTVVYADAAMAVPQVGRMVATPTMAYLVGSLQGRAISAVNRLTVGQREGQSVTISQGEVTSYNYANGAIDTAFTGARWRFRPAEQANTVTMDNNVATGTGFAVNAVGPGSPQALGVDYLTAPLAAAATANATYTPTLEDGQYEIQVYLAPSTPAQQFGQNVRVEVHEGATVTPFVINMDRGPGWYSVGTGRYVHSQANQLRFVVTNEGDAADVTAGRLAFADAVRFIGAFDSEVNSTPTSARVFIRQNGGALVEQDVVFVAAEDGRVYCLDAVGNADGTTNVIWAYPTILDPNNPGATDPNINGANAPDGTGNVTMAEMPIGFGRSSPIVQRIGGVDYLFIAARNGRVYCLDIAGRGDYNFGTRLPGTTTRNWSYPNDYPGLRRAGTLGTFTNSSLVYAEVGGTPRLYVPSENGHLYALDPVGNNVTGDTTVLWDYPGRNAQLPPITTTPLVFNDRIYFGTTIDSANVGHFYSVNAATGAVASAQEFIPAAGQPTLRGFFGGPTVIDAVTLGGAGAVDTIYVSNNNLSIYALDAANINNVIWRTDELNTTVTAPLTFTFMNVFDQTQIPGLYPTVMVPGDNGTFTALFARGGLAGNGVTNSFGGKFAWQNVSASGIVAGTSVGSPTGQPGFMYGGDLAGNLFAWSNTTTLPGQGEPPISPVIEPDNPDGAPWRDAKVKVIDRTLYESLRNDPTTTPYNTVATLIQTPPYAFEWGQTAYFVVYDFPYNDALGGGTGIAPALVNFQISTEGATTRQFSVVARQFQTGATAGRDGYAILAFAIQGSGPNSLPPGRGRVSYSVTPARTSSTAQPPQVAQNQGNYLEFQVANPLAIDMSPAPNDEIGLTNVTNDPGALVNGTPDLVGTPGNNETLLTTTFGLTGHATTGSVIMRVYDRSLMTFLRGPGRGVDQVRVMRPELEWLGGSAAILKAIPTGVFGNLFEDLPDDRPNVSLDYPNIRAENVRVTKDPTGQAENPGFSGVFLRPPTTSSGAQLLNEADGPSRALVGTDFLFEVDVPRFQPANNSTLWATSIVGTTIPSGYSGRVSVFVDSNNDGQLNTLSGRLEANRGFWLNGSIAVDEAVVVRTPNVDLGSLPGGAGYSPAAPATAGSSFNPWPFAVGTILAGTADSQGMFKPFVVENPGNVNLLNLRLAKASNQGATRFSWGIYSTSVDEFGWIDGGVGLWSDIDSVFARTPQVILQKARVGDRSSSVLQTNPVMRPNSNLDTNGGRFLPAPFSDNPRVAVTLPIGFPVGTYSQMLRVIEDDNGDESLALNGNNVLEAASDPTLTVTLKARETRLTNDFTRLTAPMADEPGVLGTAGAAFLHQNLQPSAARVTAGGPIGHMLVAWTSSRAAAIATQPTNASGNDLYRIYVAGLNGNNGVPDTRSDPRNGVQDLTGYLPATGNRWFNASPTTSNGYPAPGYVYPLAAGEIRMPETERYGAAALPAKGQINTVVGLISNPAQFANFDMAFIGDAQKQTPSGRLSESRLFMTRVTMQGNGTPVLDPNPSVMPFDTTSQKGRPSVVRIGDLIGTPAVEDITVIAYSALSSGNSRIFVTQFDYNARGGPNNGFTQPQAIEFGEAFESVSSPSITIRPYQGADATIGQAVYDLSFTGKLRGRKVTEVFMGRLRTDFSPANFPQITSEVLTPDSETGLFRARGVEWDMSANIVLQLQTNTGALVALETPGTRRTDGQTGLIVMDTALGGKAYLDPRMGTVRLSTGLPLTTQRLVLQYTPKFVRVSAGTTAGYVGVSTFHDNRFEGLSAGNTKYWGRPNNTTIIVPGDTPQVNRFFLSYNRAAAGAGQAARPFMKTMRMGVQLPFQIYTNQAGDVQGLTVTGATGFFQVDPVKGRIYFSAGDEDRQVQIQFSAIDPSTGNPIPQASATYRVTLVPELDEAPVPIEQAVNESNMFIFPDPFASPTFARPNLVWMFWSSTRGGSPDLYFQTVAPRFAPQRSGN